MTGLSPQVVTETVYALATEAPDRLPDEIHVATTLEGRRRVELNLFDSETVGGRGHFRRLCNDYGLDFESIRFDESTVHVIQGADGAPLADITTDEDNRAAADTLVNLVRELSSEPGTLHVSLAGGRKTMGYFAGYALSLFGRPQDSLSHVLVNAPFEAHPDFYYPPPKARILNLPGRNEVISTAEARVQLADIPFVRLRNGLDTALIDGRRSFVEVVRAAQASVEPPTLQLDFLQNRFLAAGIPLKLTDTHRLWMYWMARRVLNDAGPVAFDEDGAADLVRAARALDGAPLAEAENAYESLQRHNDRDYFHRTRSRLNDALRKALGPALGKRYQVANLGRRGQSVYGLQLKAMHIQLRR